MQAVLNEPGKGTAIRRDSASIASLEKRATEQNDGELAIIVRRVAKAGQIGGPLVLTSGVQRAQADDEVA